MSEGLNTPEQRGQQWLETFLQLAGLPSAVQTEIPAGVSTSWSHVAEAEGDTEEPETQSCWLTIDESGLLPEQVQALLGAEGQVLDAVQYLANSILNLGQSPAQQRAYTVELAGYRVRRQAELFALAEQALEKVRQTGQEVELKSLSAAERRQVHTFLKPFTEVKTYSRGREPDRRLVVQRSLPESSS